MSIGRTSAGSVRRSGSILRIGALTMTDVQPVIVTERLQLRVFDPSDVPLLERHAGDPRVARATRSIPHPLPPGAVDAFVERTRDPARREDCWAIDGTPIGRAAVVGVISLVRLDRGQSEIGYWVAPDAWGCGIASEAVQALVAANPHGDNTIFAEVFQDNPASARVLANAGFRWLGDAESFSVARGALVPTWTYSLNPR